MKKLILILFITLLLSGCSNTEIKVAVNNMNKLDSFEYKVDIDLNYNLIGNEVLDTIDYEGKYNEIYALEKKQIFFGNFEQQQIYIKDNYEYFNYNDNWYKKSINEYLNFNIFKKAKNVSNENNLYTVSLDENNFDKFIKFFIENASFNKEETKITLTINNKLIEKINIIGPVNYANRDYNCEIVITFSNFNGLEEINIPSTLISDALDYTIYEKTVLVEDYIDALVNYMYNQNLTTISESIELDGVIPSEINITFIDDVMDGTITIDDYKATIKENDIIDFQKLK